MISNLYVYDSYPLLKPPWSGSYSQSTLFCLYLDEKGIEYKDYGCDSLASVDYPVYFLIYSFNSYPP